MNKKKRISRLVVEISVLVLMTLVCSAWYVWDYLTYPGFNSVLGLNHYVPPEGSNLGIEFDYPRNWEWVYHPDYTRVSVFEPDKPLFTPGEIPTPSEAGEIDIDVDIGAAPESQGEQIELWLYALSRMGDDVLEDKTIVIDGVSARWISSQIHKRLVNRTYFEAYIIYVFVYENHNLYSLCLDIPFERRNDEFVSDFNKMISTIEFVP